MLLNFIYNSFNYYSQKTVNFNMGRRYYCDYCDKVFIDDIEARKKHLSCVHHLKLKKAHYDSFKDLSEKLVEETSKLPCRRFMTSYCHFEDNCKFTHYTQQELYQIKQMISYQQQQKLMKQYTVPAVPMPEEWIAKYLQKRDEKNENVSKVFWSYPQQLESRFDLPPSIKKFQPEYFKDSEFTEWGCSDK